MNCYSFDDIEIGMEERFQRTITAEMMEQFKLLSGDINPLHCNEEYACGLGYPGRVVYGMLTAALYSTLAGVYLPGEKCLLHSVNAKFRKPVFIGDTLQVSGRVSEKNETFNICTVKAEISNQTGEKVSKAIIEFGFCK